LQRARTRTLKSPVFVSYYEKLAFYGASKQNSHMTRYLPFGISIMTGLSWVVGFSAFGKILGISSPPKFQPHSGALGRLSVKVYACLYGALGWGMAMFVAFLVDDYFQGKLPNNPLDLAVRIASEVVMWLAAGCLFGWMMWGGYRKEA
jgi:hypothetical protein